MAKISQREARRMRKQNAQLLHDINAQRGRYGRRPWPGGIHILDLNVPEASFATIKTARALNHGVTVLANDNGQTISFYALPLPAGAQ